MNKLYTILALSFSLISFSQVGIGTTNPQETLHVNGTLRVNNLTTSTATKLIGTDGNGTMSNITLDDKLEILSGQLRLVGGETKYGIAVISMPLSNATLNNLNLDLNGTNLGKTVFLFRSSNGNSNFTITGIQGGTDGRVIILLTDSVKYMTKNKKGCILKT